VTRPKLLLTKPGNGFVVQALVNDEGECTVTVFPNDGGQATIHRVPGEQAHDFAEHLLAGGDPNAFVARSQE
jgi:hypothetical protein